MTPDQDVALAARLAIPGAIFFTLAGIAALGWAVTAQARRVRGWLAWRRARAALAQRQYEARHAYGITVVPATVPLDDEDRWFKPDEATR